MGNTGKLTETSAIKEPLAYSQHEYYTWEEHSRDFNALVNQAPPIVAQVQQQFLCPLCFERFNRQEQFRLSAGIEGLQSNIPHSETPLAIEVVFDWIHRHRECPLHLHRLHSTVTMTNL